MLSATAVDTAKLLVTSGDIQLACTYLHCAFCFTLGSKAMVPPAQVEDLKGHKSLLICFDYEGLGYSAAIYIAHVFRKW